MTLARSRVFDVYPPVGSQYFVEYVGAVVSCWVSERYCGLEADTESAALSASMLAEEGWRVSAVVSNEVVSAETYRSHRQGREMFRQALRDGIYFDVVRQRREFVGEWQQPFDCRMAMVEACVKGDGVYSFATANQYANGVLESDNEFLPVWPSRASASAWARHWADHQLVEVNGGDELVTICEASLDQDAFMYLGLGTSNGILTFHPADVLDGIRHQPSRR